MIQNVYKKYQNNLIDFHFHALTWGYQPEVTIFLDLHLMF